MSSDRKKILLAVDGSRQSLDTVRYTGKMFPPHKVQVVLFYVLSRIPEVFYDFGENIQHRHATIDLSKWESALDASIKRFMGKAHQILLESGLPDHCIGIRINERKRGIARDILAEAAEGYCAVIVGRRGEVGNEELNIGGTANKIIENLTRVPVLVVGGEPSPGKILLALDGSENAMRAVEFVGTMSGDPASEVTLFYVMRGFNIYQKRYEDLFEEKYEEEWGEVYEIESVFENAKIHLAKRDFDTSRLSIKLVPGASSRSLAIIKEARQGGYGTIVIGRRGVSKVREFFMGRVCNKVVQLCKEQAVWVIS